MIAGIRVLENVDVIFGMEFHPRKAHGKTHILISGFI